MKIVSCNLVSGTLVKLQIGLILLKIIFSLGHILTGDKFMLNNIQTLVHDPQLGMGLMLTFHH